MTRLFISYRSLDSAKVDALVSRLRSLKNSGGTSRYDIWQDKTSIPVGQDWWKAIVQGITDCHIFIFMISRESVANVNCRAELSYARKRNRAIIPLVLEGEFAYNPVTGKNDLAYWEHIPAELRDGRFQFLFYEGVSFVQQLNQAVEMLVRQGLRDIPAPEPPDPRNANDATNDTALIYDQACDYAGRLEFATAERLFQRLVDWRDPLFGDDSHEWIILLRAYEQMARLDERASVKYKIPDLWKAYMKQFPKPFTPLFDPKDFNSRYGTAAQIEQPQPIAPTNLQPRDKPEVRTSQPNKSSETPKTSEAPATPSIRGLLRRARIRIEMAPRDSDIDEAVDILAEALALDPTNSEVIDLLVQVAGQYQHSYLRVSDLFDRHRISLNRLPPARPDVDKLLSSIKQAYHAGDYQQVIDQANDLLKLQPGNAAALEYRQKAEDNLSRGVIPDHRIPVEARQAYNQANNLARDGHYDEAERLYRSALEIAERAGILSWKDAEQALLDIQDMALARELIAEGDRLLQRGQLREALRKYEGAARVVPNDPQTQERITRVEKMLSEK